MKAMILAAGRGTRMGELTRTTPKPLIKLHDKPLIVHHIEKLVASGITEIVINHAYLGEKLEQALGDGTQFGAHIHYSREPADAALETGGGIYQALPLLGAEPFLVINADVWTNANYGDFKLTNLETLGHLWLVDNPKHNAMGDFYLNGAMLNLSQGQPMTFSGISVLSPELFANAKPGAFRLAPLFKSAIEQSKLSAQLLRGLWVDVGTPERLELAEQMLKNSKNQKENQLCG